MRGGDDEGSDAWTKQAGLGWSALARGRGERESLGLDGWVALYKNQFHRAPRTCPQDNTRRAGLIRSAPDAQLAFVIRAPALDPAPGHNHARVKIPQSDAVGREACACQRDQKLSNILLFNWSGRLAAFEIKSMRSLPAHLLPRQTFQVWSPESIATGTLTPYPLHPLPF